MPAPGPPLLGRGVIVGHRAAPPPPWTAAERVGIDQATLDAPAETVERLHRAWSSRTPLVIELSVDPTAFRQPLAIDAEPWTLCADLELWPDRLHFLLWANNYDARQGDPVWWWGRKALRLGATEFTSSDGAGDVLLADGTPAWIDGGPRGPWDGDDLGAVVPAEEVEGGRLTVTPAATAPSGDLAADQLAAVAHRAGPVRVIAPAGSGKTRVLTERLRHLLADRGYARDTTLAVAYNVKARDELVARTADLAPRVQTLNGLAYSLVADHRGHAPTVLDEREVRRLLDRLAPTRRRQLNTDPVAAYLDALTEVRLGLRDPSEVEAERDDVPGLAELFDPYRAELARRQALDFDEQVYAAIEALLSAGAFRRRAQQRHRHLLVDELQDLTPAHVLMLRLLAGPAADVFGVGDDDQVIYGHAGADPRFLIDFDHYFPGDGTGGGHHALEVNYRCPVAVVDAARSLVSRNRRRVDKTIKPRPDAATGADRLQLHTHRRDGGTRALVDAVSGWLSEPAVAPSEVAVLGRVASALLAPQVALTEAAIPVTSILGPEVLGRTGIRAALAWMRVVTDPHTIDPADLAEIYRRPSRGLPTWVTKWFRGAMSPDRLRSAAQRIDDDRVAGKLEDFAFDIELVAAVAKRDGTRATLEAVRDKVGLGEAMARLDESKGGEGSSQLDDLEALMQVADLHADPASFEPWLEATLSRAPATGGITLSTVHRVKGREWPMVAVVGVTAGLLPHRLAVDVEEERRVAHVAITRARERVLVLGDESRPSPFLAELRGEDPPALRPARPARSLGDGTSAATKREDATLTGPAADREAALRAWRSERSREDDVPAYVVASNAVLAAVATADPANLAELGRIKGIGPAKVDRYGAAILAVLAACR